MRLSIFALLLPLCLSACSDATTNDNTLSTATNKIDKSAQSTKLDSSAHTPISRETIQSTRQQLNTLITDTQCDNSTQCQVLAVGSRACGGPSSYIVYSNKTADSDQVEQLATKITEQESKFNAQNDMMSICQHLSAPSTQCTENKCVKIEGNSASVY